MPRKNIMLFYPFEESRLKKWTPPFLVQPKLDGERCRALHTNQGWILLSSEENVFHSVPHILEDLQRTGLPQWTELDGELYHHGWPFESIHSVCGRTKNLHPDYKKIGYAIFDVVTNEPQIDRTFRLLELNQYLYGSLYQVRYNIAQSLEDILAAYDDYTKNGYEGIVVRHHNGLYVRARSRFVMKFKPKKSDVYTIRGFEEEISIHGEPKGRLGSFIVSAPGEEETFNVGTGFTAQQREDFWRNAGSLLLRHVIVKYQAKTAKGVPRFPVFVEVL